MLSDISSGDERSPGVSREGSRTNLEVQDTSSKWYNMCTCTCTCMYTHTCTCTCIHVHMCMYTHTCTCTYMHTCTLCTYIHACMCTCACIHIHTYIYLYMYIHAYVCTCTLCTQWGRYAQCTSWSSCACQERTLQTAKAEGDGNNCVAKHHRLCGALPQGHVSVEFRGQEPKHSDTGGVCVCVCVCLWHINQYVQIHAITVFNVGVHVHMYLLAIIGFSV